MYKPQQQSLSHTPYHHLKLTIHLQQQQPYQQEPHRQKQHNSPTTSHRNIYTSQTSTGNTTSSRSNNTTYSRSNWGTIWDTSTASLNGIS